MRQYDQVFEKPIKSGLRPEANTVDDGQFLTYASNCIPFAGILRYAEQWTETFPGIKKHAQIFNPVAGIFILTDTELYSWDGIVLTQLLPVPGSFPIAGIIPAGNAWTIADFSPVLVFTNGVCNLVRDSAGGWTINNILIPKVYDSVGQFRGRLLAGKGNTLDWSRIGQIKFLPQAVINASATLNPVVPTYDANIDTIRENSAGTRNMDWAGTIYAIHSLGKFCVVYGSGGITVLEPFSIHIMDFQLRQSVNLFKFDNKDYIGVPGTLAVIKKNEEEHRFISNDGYLYKLTVEGIKRIGYKEFISANSRLCYDSQDGHEMYVVGEASPSLAINDFGAGGLSLNASAVMYDKRVGLMVHTADGSAIDQSTIEWWSDIFYFDKAGEKTIEQVILHAHDITIGTAQVSIGVKMNSGDPWTFSDWFTFNENLEASAGVTGMMFMVKIRVTNQIAPNFHHLKLGVKYTDRRYVRGVSGVVRNDNQATT